MNAQVRYHSVTGNTKRLAEAVAEAAGAAAKPVSEDLEEQADVLFLGSSLYKFTFDPAVGEFLRRNAEKIGTLAVFGSSASGKSTHEKLRALAEPLGIFVLPREFVCLGKFLFLHRDRPNDGDLAAAAQFARDVCAMSGGD